MPSGKSLDRSQARRWNSGVVSLLDPEHYGAVEGIWDELERELGLREVRVTPWPHISFQLGDYDLDALPGILEKLAAATPRFEIETTGLGIFSGLQPVLYVPVIRTAELSEFHRLLWTAVGTVCRNASDDYWVANWVPHITLAAGDLDASNVADPRCRIVLTVASGLSPYSLGIIAATISPEWAVGCWRTMTKSPSRIPASIMESPRTSSMKTLPSPTSSEGIG